MLAGPTVRTQHKKGHASTDRTAAHLTGTSLPMPQNACAPEACHTPSVKTSRGARLTRGWHAGRQAEALSSVTSSHPGRGIPGMLARGTYKHGTRSTTETAPTRRAIATAPQLMSAAADPLVTVLTRTQGTNLVS